MTYRTIHRIVVGQIQLTALVYEKEVFVLILQKLLDSKIFQSVNPQIINHQLDQFNKNVCNCFDILSHISKQFRPEAEHFAQVFVPLIIVDCEIKRRQHLICELNFLHDNLLKSRKDFLVDDVQKHYMLKNFPKNHSTNDNCGRSCVFDLNEILAIKRNHGENFNDLLKRQNESYSEEDHSTLRKVLKKLLDKDLLPLSSESIPISSLKLQKVFDICFKHGLPDDMIVGVINNLRNVRPGTNESNNFLGSSRNDSKSKELSEKQSFPDFPENSVNYITNNSARWTSDTEGSNQKNISNNSMYPSVRRTGQMSTKPNNSFVRQPSSRKASYNPKLSSNWETMRQYQPISSQKPSQQNMASFNSKASNLRPSNWQSPKSVKFASNISQNRQADSRYPYEENYFQTRVTEESPYEVVIDDDCHDLENIEAITVRDPEGNSRVYVECEAPNSRFSRRNTALNAPSFRNSKPMSELKRINKRVSFANNEEDDYSKCGSTALTRAVLGQEANSMDSLLSILNTKVQKDGDSQCMKLSMKAEHIIRKPECGSDGLYLEEQDGCLTVSSQVQAKWENCICNEEEEFQINDPFQKPQTKLQNSMQAQGMSTKASIYNPNSFVNKQAPVKGILTYQDISNLCDKAIQTEKFLFLETENERILISPNSIYPKHQGSMRLPSTVSFNTVPPNRGASQNGYKAPEQYICYDPVENFYFYEDKNNRIISQQGETFFMDPKRGPTWEPGYQESNEKCPNGMGPSGWYREPRPPNYIKSAGSYTKDPKSSINPHGYSLTPGAVQNQGQSNVIPQAYPRTSDTFQLHNTNERLESNYQPYNNQTTNPPMHDQINYSSSASRHVFDNDNSGPEDYLYVESNRLSPVIDVQACFKHSPGNIPDCKYKNSYHASNLCHYHKFVGSYQKNNSNLVLGKSSITSCKHCFDDFGFLGKLHGGKGILTSGNSKNFQKKLPNGINPSNGMKLCKPTQKANELGLCVLRSCECQEDWTISVIPSLPSIYARIQPSEIKDHLVCVDGKRFKDNGLCDLSNDPTNVHNCTFPCLKEIVTKLKSEDFLREYKAISDLFKRTVKDKNCTPKNSIQINKVHKIDTHTENKDDQKLKKKEMRKQKKIGSIKNYSNEYKKCSEIEVDCGPFIPAHTGNLNSSFKNYFIS